MSAFACLPAQRTMAVMGPFDDATPAPTLLDRRWTRVAAIAFAVLIVGIVTASLFWFRRIGAQPTEDPVVIAQSLVSQQVPEGYTPHFNPPEWTQVNRQGRKYTVSGWLQAVGREGQIVAMNYSVDLLDGPQGWSAEHVNLTVQ